MSVTAGGIAALIAAGAFLMLVIFLAVPIRADMPRSGCLGLALTAFTGSSGSPP